VSLDVTETPAPGEGASPAGDFHECDIRDFSRLAGILRSIKPDAVAHLAAWSSAGLSFKNPTEAFEVNTQGTVNLLEAVKNAGIQPRVLTVSSCEVYTSPEGRDSLREDSPIGPVNPYGLGKACSELVAFHYQSVWDVDLTVVRPFNHTGPWQTDVFVLPSFAKQVAEAEKGLREPKLSVGNLDVVRDFTDVKDVVTAYRLLLERRPPGSVYNVCSGRGYVIRELVDQLITRSTVKMDVQTDQDRWRKAETPALVGDNTLIAKDLGWRPQIPMEKTLEDLLAHWRAHV
jgi:GDP-4-dehydro-6-deoxy-D-mannose reductase